MSVVDSALRRDHRKLAETRDDVSTTEPRADGGRNTADNEMLGTGEGALLGASVGLCAGVFFGVTFGQSGVVGAVDGSFLFDVVERRGKRAAVRN